ncbi:hypothetical protein FQN54_005068 [Arachnomyces sp. PD_36]|nr:hypothetical protein FQN54_005068 [Arachnomyces sp. PD_36]
MPENQDTPAGVMNAIAQQQQQQGQQPQQQQQVHQQAPAPSQQQAQQQPTTSVTSPSVAAAQTAQAVATAAAAVGVQPQNNNPIVGPLVGDENLACQWQGCVEVCPSPEALYEHVCERHVGRKSTNNLNLTCHWGGCRTTVVKRDHITSHIRVHVPLKPHKCEFCGKSFKRPQDLKKHVKTHADDSVLVKSPDPPGAPRQPNVMYGVPGAKNHYFESSMNQVAGQPYGHGGPQYYQHPQPNPQSNQSYGNVYYTYDGNHHAAASASYDARKRREILQDFVGMIKREEIDPTSYAAVSQRLVGLHGIQLPLAASDPIPEYHHAPAMVGVGGGGGYQPSSMPPQMYQLPPMNLRTKADLMNIDRFLEQMQSTVYEGNEEAAAAGVGQPGAHFIHGGVTYSSNNSPPTSATHLPSSHAATSGSAPISIATPSANSPHNSTPALTPPSSAQSYTSARSPISLSSAHQRSPLMNQQQNPLTSAGMYPTLPAPNSQDNFPAGYPISSSSAAPASTLGNAFDDDRRRYTGGTLQRSRPADSQTDDMDTSKSDNGGRTTPTKEHPDRGSPTGAAAPFSSSLVDPALRDNQSPIQQSPPREKKDSPIENTKSATSSPASSSQDGENTWVENIRIIECLRQYVSERLERGMYEDEDAVRSGSEEQGAAAGSGDVDMSGTGASRAHSEARAQSQSREDDAGESLYPILKALESDDGDVKMGSNEGGS